MSRRFCRLPQGFSERCALDCTRGHRHMSMKEVERLINKEIKQVDFHPITKLPRYIELVEEERSDFVDPGIVQRTQKTHISETVMRNAAGAHQIKAGRSRWLGAASRESAARNKVAAYGADEREFSRIVVLYGRMVELRNFAWTDAGISAGFREDRFDGDKVVANSAWMPKGTLLRVALKSRIPEAKEAAEGYWRFFNMSLASIMPERPAEKQENPLTGPFRSEKLVPWTVRVMAKSIFREQEAALKRLDCAWPEIVARFQAGPYSKEISSMPASELPSAIARETLRAYLQIPSERWSDVESVREGGT
jgi:hypothetical protein